MFRMGCKRFNDFVYCIGIKRFVGVCKSFAGVVFRYFTQFHLSLLSPELFCEARGCGWGFWNTSQDRAAGKGGGVPVRM